MRPPDPLPLCSILGISLQLKLMQVMWALFRPIGEYLPARENSILLHPETMRTCGFPIAAPLIISRLGRGQDGDGMTKRHDQAESGHSKEGVCEGEVKIGMENRNGTAKEWNRTATDSGNSVREYVCCKILPLPSLPLDGMSSLL